MDDATAGAQRDGCSSRGGTMLASRSSSLYGLAPDRDVGEEVTATDVGFIMGGGNVDTPGAKRR